MNPNSHMGIDITLGFTIEELNGVPVIVYDNGDWALASEAEWKMWNLLNSPVMPPRDYIWTDSEREQFRKEWDEIINGVRYLK